MRYKVTNTRSQIVYQGNDGKRAVGYVAHGLTLTREIARELADHVIKRWREEVTTSTEIQEPTHAWRDVDYKQDYLDGLPVPHVGDGRIDFLMDDQKAVAVELGWAPPNSSNWADGLETYTEGQAKDLRPYMLSQPSYVRATKQDNYSDKVPATSRSTRYRRLKFQTPTVSEMANITAEHMADLKWTRAEDRQKDTHEKARKAFVRKTARKVKRQILSQIHESSDDAVEFRSLDMSHVPPLDYRHGGVDTHHAAWVYHGAKREGNSFAPSEEGEAETSPFSNSERMAIFRTVNDSESQVSRAIFFTQGIKPARITTGRNPPLSRIIKEALANVIAGKRPDGGSRGG